MSFVPACAAAVFLGFNDYLFDLGIIGVDLPLAHLVLLDLYSPCGGDAPPVRGQECAEHGMGTGDCADHENQIVFGDDFRGGNLVIREHVKQLGPGISGLGPSVEHLARGVYQPEVLVGNIVQPLQILCIDCVDEGEDDLNWIVRLHDQALHDRVKRKNGRIL